MLAARGSRRTGGGVGVRCSGSGAGAAPSSRARSSQLDVFSEFSMLMVRPIVNSLAAERLILPIQEKHRQYKAFRVPRIGGRAVAVGG